VRLLFEALALAPIDAALDLDAAGATPQYRTSALRDLARSRSPYAPIQEGNRSLSAENAPRTPRSE